jgi:hypothetical protein
MLLIAHLEEKISSLTEDRERFQEEIESLVNALTVSLLSFTIISISLPLIGIANPVG